MTNNYSKRERVAYIADWLRWRSGSFRKYSLTNNYDIDRVVFVCKGNICRSAYAEARLRKMGRSAASFGIYAANDKPAHPIAMRIAEQRGVQLKNHRTTSIDAFRAKTNDLYACMELSQAKYLVERGYPTILLGLLADQPRIIDPYGKPESTFGVIFDQIDNAIASLQELLSASIHKSKM